METKRITRTVVQALLTGTLTEFVNQLVLDVPDRYDTYIVLLGVVVVTSLQVYADAHDIPYPGKARLAASSS